MNRLEKSIEIIHDLLQIQHERATTYERLMLYGNYDENINHILKKLATESRNCMLELRSHITDTTGGDPADRVEIRGDVLKEWHGLNQVLPDTNFQDIISAFEVNELRTAKAYEKALEQGTQLCEAVKALLTNQTEKVWGTYEFIQDSRYRPYAPELAHSTDERKPPAFFHDRLYAEV
jgi:uncharacterized protein (TIGR02284 family)